MTGFPLTENLTSTSPGCVSTTNRTVCTYGYGLRLERTTQP